MKGRPNFTKTNLNNNYKTCIKTTTTYQDNNGFTAITEYSVCDNEERNLKSYKGSK